MLPDIDSLALFVRAAETRNLTRAAEASFITVPAASRRLALLEHQFKAQLFARHSRGLELTPAGERLLKSAREVLAGVHHMRAEMANYASGSQGVLQVYGNTSAMTQFLPGDVASFQALHPDARILIQECWSAEAVRRVKSGEAHLGVVLDGADTADLVRMPYRCDRLAAVTRSDHPLAAGDRTTVAFVDVLDHDLVGLEGGSSLTRLLTEKAAERIKPMALRVQVRSFETVCRMVEAGMGVGVLPAQAARLFEQALGLRVLPLADDWAVRRNLLCIRNDVDPESLLGQLVGHLTGMAEATMPETASTEASHATAPVLQTATSDAATPAVLLPERSPEPASAEPASPQPASPQPAPPQPAPPGPATRTGDAGVAPVRRAASSKRTPGARATAGTIDRG
jgi:DNA-binding transcriptional LysR family regulator